MITILILPAILLAALLVVGCGSGEDADGNGQTDADHAYAIVLDTSPWDRFLDLATRYENAPETSPQAEWLALLDHPGYKAWLKTKSHRLPGRGVEKRDFVSWLPAIFGPDRAASASSIRKATGYSIRLEFRYMFERADRIEAWIADWRNNNQEARLRELLDRWVAAENLTDTIFVTLLPMDQQIMKRNGLYLVNASLPAASPPDQLLRQIAGNVYRNEQTLPGPDPQISDGEAVLINTWRLALNEGVMGRLQRVMDASYDIEHQRLGPFKPIPYHIFEQGIVLIEYHNLKLPEMLAEPDNAELWSGQNFIPPIRLTNAITLGGYAMSEAIVARFGEDRLIELRSDLPGFLRTYQEAARMNPQPLPTLGGPGHEHHEYLPPFAEDVLVPLLEMLEGDAHPDPGPR